MPVIRIDALNHWQQHALHVTDTIVRHKLQGLIHAYPSNWIGDNVSIGAYHHAVPSRDTIPPEFDSTPLAVSVQPGETALLPCRVRHLGDKVVSWMRRKDLLIISSGRFMFTGDQRFQVFSPEDDPASWNLQLRNARVTDEGLYECQVNTDPKLKQGILLTVSDKPEVMEMSMKDDSNIYGTEDTTILGPKERYVRVGSGLSLTCHVRLKSGLPKQRPARLVDWLHNDVPLFSVPGGSTVGVDTEKNGDELSSTLSVSSMGPEKAGKYTCKPAVANASASVIVVILEGERTEAMQGASSALRASDCKSNFFNMEFMCAICIILSRLIQDF